MKLSFESSLSWIQPKYLSGFWSLSLFRESAGPIVTALLGFIAPSPASETVNRNFRTSEDVISFVSSFNFSSQVMIACASFWLCMTSSCAQLSPVAAAWPAWILSSCMKLINFRIQNRQTKKLPLVDLFTGLFWMWFPNAKPGMVFCGYSSTSGCVNMFVHSHWKCQQHNNVGFFQVLGAAWML